MHKTIGVIVVAMLMFSGAAILAVGCTMLLLLGVPAVTLRDGGPMSALFAGMGTYGAVLFLVLACIYVVLAVSLLELRTWARPLSVYFIGIGLTFALVGIIVSLPHPALGVLAWQSFVIAVDLGILRYLTRPHVKQNFSRPAVSTSLRSVPLPAR